MEGYDMRSKLQTVLECDANCKGEAKVVKPKNRFLLPVVCLIILMLAIVIQWFIR